MDNGFIGISAFSFSNNGFHSVSRFSLYSKVTMVCWKLRPAALLHGSG
jgi:hypothetical protein